MRDDKRLQKYTIQFQARLLDKIRLQTVLERNFGARAIAVETVPLDAIWKPSAPHPNWKPRPGSRAARIVDLLSDGSVRRLSDIVRVIGGKNTPSTLVHLLKVGAIVKVARGCYAKHGVEQKELPVLRGRTYLAPALQRVYDALEIPRTAVELREALGGTRQAIEQKLKKLIERERVKRTPTVSERGLHLYVRVDQARSTALYNRQPALRDNAARILSLLPVDAPVRFIDVVGHGSSSVGHRYTVVRLAQLGLVEIAGTRNRRVVRLTAKGREHPCYDLQSEKAKSLSQTIDLDSKALSVLLVIHALGEARSLDITLATGVGRGKRAGGMGTGNYVQGLEHAGLIEAVAPIGKGHPHYRLSMTGLGYVLALRGEIPLPDPEEVRRKLADERARYRSEQQERGTRTQGVLGNRSKEIIDMLEANGPLDTVQINDRLSNPYAHSKSIWLTLRTLEKRGIVVVLREHDARAKIAILWGRKISNPDQAPSGNESI